MLIGQPINLFLLLRGSVAAYPCAREVCVIAVDAHDVCVEGNHIAFVDDAV